MLASPTTNRSIVLEIRATISMLTCWQTAGLKEIGRRRNDDDNDVAKREGSQRERR
jgi:hypothetical protein